MDDGWSVPFNLLLMLGNLLGNKIKGLLSVGGHEAPERAYARISM